MTTEKYILPLKEDGSVEFTKELLEETGWKAGIQLEWYDNGDGTVTIFEKVNEPDDGDSGE